MLCRPTKGRLNRNATLMGPVAAIGTVHAVQVLYAIQQLCLSSRPMSRRPPSGYHSTPALKASQAQKELKLLFEQPTCRHREFLTLTSIFDETVIQHQLLVEIAPTDDP